MMIIAYITVVMLNLLLAYKNKTKSKFVLLITGLFFVFVFSGNSSSGDIPNYLENYRNPEIMIQGNPLSAVFYYAMDVAKGKGLNFFEYKIVISAITYALYYRFLSKFDVNIHYIIFFYCFHLLLFDVEQIRNALALAVFLQGLIPLLKNEKNKIKKYIFFTLLASTIHVSFIVYLIFLLYYLTWKKSYRVMFVFLIVLFCLITFINGNKIPFLNIILNNFDLGGKIKAYFGNRMRLGFLIPFGLHFFTFITIWYIKRKTIKYGIENQLIKVVFRLFILSFAFLPLYMLSITFGRFERNLIPLVFLAGASMMRQLSPKHILKWKFFAITLWMVLCWCSYDIFIRANDILIPIMKYNYFINGGIYYY